MMWLVLMIHSDTICLLSRMTFCLFILWRLFNELALQAQTQRTLLERAYGSALPMKMDIERQILSRFKVQRPPGLIPSSVLGLESLTGELDEFGFGDFLNNPKESDTYIPVDMHEGMEVRLGLSKGPVSRSFF